MCHTCKPTLVGINIEYYNCLWDWENESEEKIESELWFGQNVY